ncbi:MAG: aspartate--tRNA ligase [Chlamydiia bacterium]|nr:aspartate--tRNA ligase [Chlamydiia bacterium]
MFDFRRTHHLGEIRKENIGDKATLSGWVHRRRDHGGLIFIDLRDRFGLTQLVFDPKLCPEAHQKAEQIRSEWVLSVKGKVRSRGEGMTNPNLATGEVELEVEELEILSKAKTPPFSLSDENLEVSEEVRLKFRHLDLRRKELQEKLIKRHEAQLIARNFLHKQGFVEVTTPILGKSTPEGSRDYLVPSRIHPGEFYALPQSPQVFKQLLMVAGLDRYFQICSCFRDEDLRADRQPEFTQIDIEMSFGTPEEIYALLEGLLSEMFDKLTGKRPLTPFKRMTHEEVMSKYGSDKPDLRYGMQMSKINDIAEQSDFSVFKEALKNGALIKGFKVDGGAKFSRKGIDTYTAFVGNLGIKGLAWLKFTAEGLQGSIAKFFNEALQKELMARFEMKEGDLIFMIADDPDRCNLALDHLRRKIAKDEGLVDPNRFEFLWVTDFPLFHWNEEENRLDSLHHPFTAPHPEDIHLMDSDPLKVRSLGYDIVLNGYEIGGGSQRIHDSEFQENIFKALNLTPEAIKKKFGFFVEALKYGTPPHLGLALGLDRIMMIATKTDNIRDVIAFPKTQKASDLMMDCPSEVDPEQLKELKLKLN